MRVVLAVLVAAALLGCTPPAGSPSTGATATAQSSESPAPSLLPSPTPAASAAAHPSRLPEPVARIAIPGQAPAAIAVGRDGLWVFSIESGDLTLVDPASASVVRSIHIGGMGSHVAQGSDGRLFAARFDTGGSGDYLTVVDPDSGKVSGVATGPLGALTLDEEGFVLALEKADQVLRVDPATLQVVGRQSVDVNDEHVEVLAAYGFAWVASDSTPVRRLLLPSLEVVKTIDAGGGIPFVASGDLIWGARPGTLWAIDPATNAVTREIPLDGVIEVLALDVAGTDAWLAVRMTGRVGMVVRLDLTSGSVVGTYPVSLPAGVRILDDRVWIASYLDNELLAFVRAP